jgi:hypothetical protein
MKKLTPLFVLLLTRCGAESWTPTEAIDRVNFDLGCVEMVYNQNSVQLRSVDKFVKIHWLTPPEATGGVSLSNEVWIDPKLEENTLTEVLLHQLGRQYNLPNSTNSDDIMYPMVVTPLTKLKIDSFAMRLGSAIQVLAAHDYETVLCGGKK